MIQSAWAGDLAAAGEVSDAYSSLEAVARRDQNIQRSLAS